MKERKIGGLDYLAIASGTVPDITVSTLASAFLLIYFTDVVGISAAVIGTIVLIMRFSDGASDLIMGHIIDRTKTRWGKARPWLVPGTISLAMSLIFLFYVPPGFSTTAQIVYFAIVYFFVMSVFITMCGIASSAILPMLTKDNKKRNNLGAANMAGTMVGGIIATAVTNSLLGLFGYTQLGYTQVMVIYALLILITGLFCFARLREQNDETGGVVVEAQENISLKKSLSVLRKNKYFFLATSAGILINLNNAVISGLGLFFTRDVFGSEGLFTILTLAMLLPVLFGLPFSLALVNKFGKHKVLSVGMAGCLTGVVISAISLIIPTPNIALFFTGVIFTAFCRSSFSAGFQALMADICDYGEWKTGIKQNGIVFGSKNVGIKVGLGLGTAIVGWILAFAAYDGTLAIQSDFTIIVQRHAMAWTPVICFTLVFICLFLCNLEKIMPQVRKDLTQRQQ